MDLSQQQFDKLWGEEGPYSQASIIIQSRILDDKVSRVFIEVEADINPFTFELVEQHRDQFADDEKLLQLLDRADYRGLAHGYVVCAFRQEYTDPEVFDHAQKHLEYTKETIIKMHRFVMEWLEMYE